ncbi:hypothetical protein TREES_T100020934 [Tupaia chinensis]|uniref:Uncharacterized protein n=1 Tax=Tupaia chinensis TaxID=246437 RepID=L9JDE8_TUPCH|nr:hypothetical protein TREES_T100020934 [Tupaia chinensis]
MASGNGLSLSSALVAKRPCALGPFPRYIWIHQDTPQDSLDKTCHEIWKRVQGLPEALQREALQPGASTQQLSAPQAGPPTDHWLSCQEDQLGPVAEAPRGFLYAVCRAPAVCLEENDQEGLGSGGLEAMSIKSHCEGEWSEEVAVTDRDVSGNSEDAVIAPGATDGTHAEKRAEARAPEPGGGKDEISLLVEQEFLSLTKEHLVVVRESSGELEAPREPAPCMVAPPLGTHSGEHPGASVTASDKLPEQKVAVSITGSRQDCDSAVSTVTGILRAAKVKSAKGMEDGGHSLGASNSEISQLLAQFSLKAAETSKTPDNKTVLEETRAIKDFLQNSMFSGPGPGDPTGLGPFLLLPPLPPPAASDKLPDLPAQKKQLPVFAKICSMPEADPAVEGHHLMGLFCSNLASESGGSRTVESEVTREQIPLMTAEDQSPQTVSLERNPGTKELTKGQENLFLSKWPQSRKDTRAEDSGSDPVSTMPVALPTKKPAWPAEKNLLYEFLGATKNPSGQLKLRSKAEVDGLELKFNPPATAADKNNLKYTGNVFTPRFATALTSATPNQPFWLNLNYPPPPVFANHSAFPQYQVGPVPTAGSKDALSASPAPPAGVLLPTAGYQPCFLVHLWLKRTDSVPACEQKPSDVPYGTDRWHVAEPPQGLPCTHHASLRHRSASYVPFVQPNYPYPQRTTPKLSANPRDPSPMAGDGPQYLFPQAYGFGSTSGGPLMNSPYFSSSGNGISF